MHLDSHIHLWALDDGEPMWIRDKIAALHRDFSEADLRALRARCKVGGAIVVHAAHTIRETQKWLERAEKSDQLAGVIGWLDIFSDELAAQTRAYQRSPKFVGLRPLPSDTFSGDWLGDARSKPAIKLLQALDVSVDILQRVQNLPRARAFFREFPDLRLVLDHGGRPAVMTGLLEPWRSEIRAFAKETSAVVKCSGLVERAGVEWSKDSVKPYVAELIDAFGTQRTMFATNWPISTISATYDLWVDTLVQILDELGLTQEQKDDVMWRTASRHYRIQWPQ
jgi:L-fuconolactonase